MRIQELKKWTRSAKLALTWSAEGWRCAIAVIMPNSDKVKRTDWQDYLVSVDQVEDVTGYDFFAYLNDDVESEIESKIYQ